MVVFVHQFDVLKGNRLLWTNGDPKKLEGLEFTVLPSGIHKRNRDVVYFSWKGKSGLSLFRQNARDLDSANHHIDRSKVLMFSFGAIFDEELDWEELARYETGMIEVFDKWWEEQDNKMLEAWDRGRFVGEIEISKSSFCRSIGPIVSQIWRYSLLNERILVLNKGISVAQCNILCNLIAKFGNMKNASYKNLMTLSLLDEQRLRDSDCWCGTTSDEIIIYNENTYDKLIIWDAQGIHIKDHEREFKCNEVDFTVYKALTGESLNRFQYQYESSIIWSKLIIDGLFFLFTGNFCKPWYHLEVNPIQNADLYQYFTDRTEDIWKQLHKIERESEEVDTIYTSANILISLELDYFCDSEFVTKLSQIWFEKPIILTYFDLKFSH